MAVYGTAKYGLNLYGSAAEHPYGGTAGRVMWLLQVDWDRDGLFGAEIEPQSISRVRILRGRGRRLRADGLGQLQPGNERFEITIVDPARRYDAFNSSSPIYDTLGAPGLLIRLLAVSTTARAPAEPVFTGTLTSVNYDHAGGRGVLRGEGLSRYLQLGRAASLYPPCQSFSSGAWDSWFTWDGSTPFPINYWRGRPGGLTLTECARLTLERAGWPLGAYYGAKVFSGDQPEYFYFDGSPAWEVLRDLADAFAARLFFLRDGRLFVMDRGDSTGMGYALPAPPRAQAACGVKRDSPFETLRNKAEVRIRPHSVMPFNSPILNSYYLPAWTNAGPVEVLPLSSVEFNIHYSELNIAAPKQGNFVRVNSDALTEARPMSVWSKADKTGVNMSPGVGNGEGYYALVTQQIGENANGLTYVQSGNNQAFCTVRLTNNSALRTAYFFDLQVQVIGLMETGERGSAVYTDPASSSLFGERVLSVNSRWIQTKSMAANIGQAYVNALSTRERASTAGITYQWSGEALYNNLLLYDVGGHVDFGAAGGAGSLSNFGTSGRWLIVGQRLEWISPDGQDALVELTYEKPALVNVTVNEVSTQAGSLVSSLSWSHTVSQADNRLLLVGISKRDAGGYPLSVTYGGAALSAVGGTSQAAGDAPFTCWYRLLNPAVGTAEVVVTLSAPDYPAAGAISLSNVRQSFPFGNPAVLVSNSAAAGPAVISLAAEPGDLVLDLIGYRNAQAGAGAGQVLRWSITSDGTWRGGCTSAPGAQAVEMRWNVPAGGFAQTGLLVKTSGV